MARTMVRTPGRKVPYWPVDGEIGTVLDHLSRGLDYANEELGTGARGIVAMGTGDYADGVLNLGMSGLGAGISIAESSVDVFKEVGTGTLKAGKKLLDGLFDTGKGLATLDAKQVEKGIAG